MDCGPKAPLSMGFPRQECWSGLPFPSPEDLPDLGIKPRSTALQVDSLSSELPGKFWVNYRHSPISHQRGSWKLESSLCMGQQAMCPNERLLLNHTNTLGFLAAGGEEFNLGPETRLDRSELLCNKVLLKYKGDKESFWHRHQKGAERVPPC